MSSSSDNSPGLFGGLIVGFIALAGFGLATFLALGSASLKKPTDRVLEGDFSAERISLRTKVLSVVEKEQAAAVDEAKLAKAMASLKPVAPGKSAVVVQGSETEARLNAKNSQPPAPKDPPPEEKPTPPDAGPKPEAPKAKGAPKEKGKAKAKAKANNNKGKAKAADAPKPGKGKGKADGPKATPKGKAEPKPGNGGSPKAADPANAPE